VLHSPIFIISRSRDGHNNKGLVRMNIIIGSE
jgi:hypothetical protein